MKNFSRKIIKALNIVVIIALLLSASASFIHPDFFWQINAMALAFPVIFIANFLFIILWVWRRKSWFLFSLIAAIISWNSFTSHFQFKGNNTQEKGINVLSYNVHYFKDIRKKQHQLDSIILFLNQQKADIICLQEARMHKTGKYNPANLKQKLTGIKHYQLAHTSNKTGPLTYTRFPIVDMGEIRFKNSGNIVIYTDIKIQSDTIRVYNCHLQSYKMRRNDFRLIDTLKLNANQQQIKGLKQIGSKMKRAMIMRAQQSEQVKEHIKKSPYKVIVCGDFNAPPVSYTYRKIKENLNDAFIQSGEGWGKTFHGKLMSFRIDYILTSDELKSHNYQQHDVDFSDHYPISATILN